MEESINEMLRILSEAPDTQIDKMITDELRGLIGKPIPEIKTGVMKAIDDCVYGSLSSDFGLMALGTMFEYMLDGKPEDFNDENCPWRRTQR